MFNHHLSVSHPPPVHRSEETGLRNRLCPVQNKSWQFILLALMQHSQRPSQGVVDQIDITYFAIIKQRQILRTHKQRQTYCLLRFITSDNNCSTCRFVLKGRGCKIR